MKTWGNTLSDIQANLKSNSPDQKDEKGNTALHALLLIDGKNALESKDVKPVLDKMNDLNTENNQGKTPLCLVKFPWQAIVILNHAAFQLDAAVLAKQFARLIGSESLRKVGDASYLDAMETLFLKAQAGDKLASLFFGAPDQLSKNGLHYFSHRSVLEQLLKVAYQFAEKHKLVEHMPDAYFTETRAHDTKEAEIQVNAIERALIEASAERFKYLLRCMIEKQLIAQSAFNRLVQFAVMYCPCEDGKPNLSFIQALQDVATAKNKLSLRDAVVAYPVLDFIFSVGEEVDPKALIDFLMLNGASVWVCGSQSKTPIVVSAVERRYAFAQTLMQHPNFTIPSENEAAPLMTALLALPELDDQQIQLMTRKAVENKKIDIGKVLNAIQIEGSPLVFHISAERYDSDTGLVTFLCQQGLSFTLLNGRDESPFMKMIQREQYGLAKALIEQKQVTESDVKFLLTYTFKENLGKLASAPKEGARVLPTDLLEPLIQYVAKEVVTVVHTLSNKAFKPARFQCLLDVEIFKEIKKFPESSIPLFSSLAQPVFGSSGYYQAAVIAHLQNLPTSEKKADFIDQATSDQTLMGTITRAARNNGATSDRSGLWGALEKARKALYREENFEVKHNY